MRNRHRLTRFTPSNSTVSSTNVELENGSRCQKVLMGDNILLWGCQKFCHGGEPWLPQRHDMLGQIGGRPFQGETRETQKNRRHPGRCQGCFSIFFCEMKMFIEILKKNNWKAIFSKIEIFRFSTFFDIIDFLRNSMKKMHLIFVF